MYEGLEGIRVLRGKESRNQLGSILYHLAPGEPVMMLGHGSPSGLFRLEDDGNRLYIGKSAAYCLRKHPVIGIFCHADKFAQGNRLHGLFSGMIISELEEAREYGVHTTAEELEKENILFAKTLARLLGPGRPYTGIPSLMSAAVGEGAPGVRMFNYNSLNVL